MEAWKNEKKWDCNYIPLQTRIRSWEILLYVKSIDLNLHGYTFQTVRMQIKVILPALGIKKRMREKERARVKKI